MAHGLKITLHADSCHEVINQKYIIPIIFISMIDAVKYMFPQCCKYTPLLLKIQVTQSTN